MADNTPAEKFGEVKVIKNEKKPREDNDAGRPGGTPEIQDPAPVKPQNPPPDPPPIKAQA